MPWFGSMTPLRLTIFDGCFFGLHHQVMLLMGVLMLALIFPPETDQFVLFQDMDSYEFSISTKVYAPSMTVM